MGKTVAYVPHGAADALFGCRDHELLMEGPAGTGKSRAVLEKVSQSLLKYPGARALIVRKTRASMTESVLVTLEEKVLPTGSPIASNTLRRVRQSYEYPKGSALVVGGMDNPDRIMSTEYDMIAAFEATELTEDDWEKLTTRLRNGVMPYQQAIADCNPAGPSHWLNQRANKGTMTRLRSRHNDNPVLWDQKAEKWTDQGESYLATLGRLTGARAERLLAGRWVAADGLVYEDFDAAIHVLAESNHVARRVVASVDWGFTNPGVIHVYELDGDDRMYLVHEVYRSKRTIEWWVEQARQIHTAYRPEVFACDPAEPGFIQQFQNAGLPAIGAYNDIEHGTNAVRERLKKAGDGKPRLFFLHGAMTERDEVLDSQRLPLGVVEEIEGYVMAKPPAGKPANAKEEPADLNNHGCDTLRYAVAYVDGLPTGPLEWTGSPTLVV